MVTWINPYVFASTVSGPFIFDDFNRADSASLGANWVESGDEAIEINGNRMSHDETTAGFACWVTEVGDPDHYVKATNVTIPSLNSPLITLIARCDTDSPGDGGTTFYMAGWQSNYYRIWRYVAGSGTVVAQSANSRQTNVTYRFEVEGSAQRLYVDDVLKVSASDSTITAGEYVGVRMDRSGQLDNFESDVL